VKRLDIATIAGLAIAFGLILFGNHLEGGHMSAVIQPTAALIVFGGTFGAVMVGFSMEQFVEALKALKLFFGNKQQDGRKLLDEIVRGLDRNGAGRRPGILAWLRQGMSVAYCSDAGTPLVADPGYRLAEAAMAEGLGLTAIPGASAVLTALSLAGLPTDRFLFVGFLPPKRGARRTALGELAGALATLSVKDAAREVATRLGLPRREVYARALELVK